MSNYSKFVTLSSDYCTTLELDTKPKYSRDDDKFTASWIDEFMVLAMDFRVGRKRTDMIIHNVLKTSSSQDKGEDLYIRAMNKLYDII